MCHNSPHVSLHMSEFQFGQAIATHLRDIITNHSTDVLDIPLGDVMRQVIQKVIFFEFLAASEFYGRAVNSLVKPDSRIVLGIGEGVNTSPTRLQTYLSNDKIFGRKIFVSGVDSSDYIVVMVVDKDLSAEDKRLIPIVLVLVKTSDQGVIVESSNGQVLEELPGVKHAPVTFEGASISSRLCGPEQGWTWGTVIFRQLEDLVLGGLIANRLGNTALAEKCVKALETLSDDSRNWIYVMNELDNYYDKRTSVIDSREIGSNNIEDTIASLSALNILLKIGLRLRTKMSKKLSLQASL